MLDSADFLRVKNLWPTRIGRSKSSASAGSQETTVQEVATPTAEYRESVVENEVEPQTPHTPALDADFHRYTMDNLQVFKPVTGDHTTPVSPTSSSSTSASEASPSSSPETLPDKALNPVTSMFRTLSEACMFPSIMNKPHPAPTSSSAASSTLLSIPTPWRSLRSNSDSIPISSSSSSTFSFASVSLTSTLPPREAAENAINNVHNVCSRCRTAVSSSISRGSPYGELVVVDVLEARGLAADRDECGADLPFAVTMHLGRLSRKTKSADRGNCAVNERFVFWLASSPAIDQRTLDVFVRGGDERDLGEVHLSLSMPVNEAFADWYPLVCRSDGLKHGSLKVAMRRLVLTSSPMVEAAKTLGERETSLNFCDSGAYGELLPELWSCFPGNKSEVISSSPPQEDDITSKLGRLIGFQDVQRNVF